MVGWKLPAPGYFKPLPEVDQIIRPFSHADDEHTSWPVNPTVGSMNLILAPVAATAATELAVALLRSVPMLFIQFWSAALTSIPSPTGHETCAFAGNSRGYPRTMISAFGAAEWIVVYTSCRWVGSRLLITVGS